MSLVDAVIAAGSKPPDSAPRAAKKRYSELLSRHLAIEVAEGLRSQGFPGVRPARGGPGERAFQGGLGPKKVDVSYSDEQHGLILALSIKTISFAPFGKNLKNRFFDVLSEAVTLHLRFPYSVVCALFAFPSASALDTSAGRVIPTFQRAAALLATVAGRKQYTDPGEKLEDIALALYEPVGSDHLAPWVRLYAADTLEELTEAAYFNRIRVLHDLRNPHATIGSSDETDEQE